jgi:DNA polymerase III delta prime subunit
MNIPFVEKYRPTIFDDIVLDPLNKKILKNIIETNYFPNLLFFGPPGTGKTTTIINLINAYQEKSGIKNKDLIIHLNASDERGIDIIRNQINSFVNSKPLFNNGMKFVILDEVDYMTKNAQQALRYLLQNYSCSVRFCLICNYISRIDEGLQDEFIRLRFNQLPKKDIVNFLRNISIKENIGLKDENLESITEFFNSDIRSMVNFIQSNQNSKSKFLILKKEDWDKLFDKIQNKESIANLIKEIQKISLEFNIDKKNIIKDFLNYIIQNEKINLSKEFLSFIESLLHTQSCNNKIFYQLALSKLSIFIQNQKFPN